MYNGVFNMKKDHIKGNFEWKVEPDCCEQFHLAMEQKFIFISNASDLGTNLFYIMPLDSDGDILRQKGVLIHYCPWCGHKIKGRKKYPLK